MVWLFTHGRRQAIKDSRAHGTSSRPLAISPHYIMASVRSTLAPPSKPHGSQHRPRAVQDAESSLKMQHSPALRSFHQGTLH
ncbi:hypothetical protein CCUS01_00824 [Colletotrichum cuscutae]|uniref:Uncharacterized protein n=2 Tax=Colletotrichum acutatum species complex TaxID=2707335 RepID=A0AAI9V849_9PEZI|nr:uncharacterized protein CTAM01_16005 [Colletotrichum tamarilloi]KAK1470709.1 hypothetical protein CCUS01_00824 [Colletotrichum cuscutae]KAK1474118.1 hypothetical protein CTAM01_16005 [Colletotrichum tamarilloi]